MAVSVLTAIPVYNEAEHLSDFLHHVLQYVGRRELLVVDDGSVDATAKLLLEQRIVHLHHEKNLGKGAALLDAIRYAQKNGFDWLLCLDGDGQHNPDDIPAFLHEIENDTADIILGDRQDRQTSMPLHRRLSNCITSWILSWMIRSSVPIKDSQCGFRALRLAQVDPDRFSEQGFQFESEQLLLLGRQGFRITCLPITTIYGAQKSNIHLWQDSFRFLRLVLKYLK